VNIAQVAKDGGTIPEGWAVDERGDGTRVPQAALLGALLAFGGSKGANMALMVEVLSAGLAEAAWSLGSPDFRRGNRSPNAGLTIIAISPPAISPNFGSRLAGQLRRLRHFGVYVPGQRSKVNSNSGSTFVELNNSIFEEISRQLQV
jgi:(2R)-3-sulfolactate dehydrogenase (NADP+)